MPHLDLAVGSRVEIAVALVHLGVDLKKEAKALVQNVFKAAVREKANWEPPQG